VLSPNRAAGVELQPKDSFQHEDHALQGRNKTPEDSRKACPERRRRDATAQRSDEKKTGARYRKITTCARRKKGEEENSF
jgi:hypothetical protein